MTQILKRFKKRQINYKETQELWREKNTVIEKQEEAFSFLKDRSFKFKNSILVI